MSLLLLRLAVLVILFFVIRYVLREMRRGRPVSSGQRRRMSPYEILEVSPSASQGEIKEAYHRELAKYHPDKVAHLGAELQRLARDKTSEIIEAYESLKK